MQELDPELQQISGSRASVEELQKKEITRLNLHYSSMSQEQIRYRASRVSHSNTRKPPENGTSPTANPCVCLLGPHSNYAAANISTNLYVVSQPWLYSLAWCAGAHSVTTNAPQVLRDLLHPLFLMVRNISAGHESPQGWEGVEV